VTGKPSQVEACEYDAGNVAVGILEALREMNHSLVVHRIDPIISDGKPGLSHRTRKERLIGHRWIEIHLARTKNPTINVGRPKQTIIGKAGF
jgi:hypothetical protein